ncbi:uncharacterized protein LOC128202281 [Galleria mellonella]|uniref:Uncharacterized protein LOC128202281 n=1 Tax=Galleria mellonella TaxID=7137 RepID=A0ABM3N3G0_GALME|nr:uncharacterized protein LOC128202281 [Galleria mellonella]
MANKNYIYKYSIVVLLVCSLTAGDECVTYSFEDGLNDFAWDHPTCHGINNWTLGWYNTISIERPHPASNTFVTPAIASLPTVNCISTRPLEVAIDGTVELNIYLERANIFEVEVIIQDNTAIGGSNYSSVLNAFSPGWSSIRLTLTESCHSCSQGYDQSND